MKSYTLFIAGVEYLFVERRDGSYLRIDSDGDYGVVYRLPQEANPSLTDEDICQAYESGRSDGSELSYSLGWDEAMYKMGELLADIPEAMDIWEKV